MTLLFGGGTRPLAAQASTRADERGASALAVQLRQLGTFGRVLTIGAHPDDEDTNVLAWLARGHGIETAYLSLTRGDGGQNLIGDELGEALGAIRTGELLNARRIDGGRQFFTRAFDFGFSKNAEETYRHWPKDTILGDVVRVLRAYRPHVVVAFWSGTPRDGHGHHQVAGLLAREAFDLAADTVRYPVQRFGMPWQPQAFWRARAPIDSATLRVNVGAYDAALGRSYVEVAAESRTAHRSQGQGTPQRKGVVWNYLQREVPAATPGSVSDLFAGVDTTWASVRAQLPAAAQGALDSALVLLADARARYRADDPSASVAPLARAVRLLRDARNASGNAPGMLIATRRGFPSGLSRRQAGEAPLGVYDALTLTVARAERALLQASGVAVEAIAPRGTFPVREPVKVNVNDSLPVAVTVFNRGRLPVRVGSALVLGLGARPGEASAAGELLPDSSRTVSRWAVAFASTTTWWRAEGRQGNDWFLAAIDARDEVEQQAQRSTQVQVSLEIAGTSVLATVPVVQRVVDPVLGDRATPVAALPGITLNLASAMAYIRANAPVDRIVPVRVQSSYPHPATVTVRLELPAGLKADSVERVRTIDSAGTQVVNFRVRGTVKPGRLELVAVGTHDGGLHTSGAYLLQHDHLDPIRLYGTSGMYLSAVEVARPTTPMLVGYIRGVADQGYDALGQLDIPVELIEPAMLGTMNLSRFTTIVVGPRAYEAYPPVVQHNAKLLAWARAGGKLVVQYGAQDMNRLAGVLPYPMQWAPRAARVSLEEAPVRVLAPANRLLTFPNRIGANDWANWVQERATYMPSTFDARYTPLVSMNDEGEPEQRGAILDAPLGAGRYVYVTLALFRQFPAGVPGAARLWVNLVGR
ncbi:MAG: PIG-L family deacetylase [Gemmatimonadetes bacterium]|nr:PIG-L family deacetylase [Gemmatimonadota bacterium]